MSFGHSLLAVPPLTLRPAIVRLLLLCLLRMLLPEAWVLALHGHAHTTEERAFAVARATHAAGHRQALLTPKHTHCHEDTFYSVPFQEVPALVLPAPRAQLRFQLLGAPTELISAAAALRCSALRGPPMA